MVETPPTAAFVVGAPLAVLIVGAVSPDTIGGDGPEAVWRGLSTVAGSWIAFGRAMAFSAATSEWWTAESMAERNP